MTQMTGVLGHDSSFVQGFNGPGTTRANEMNFIKNHAPGAGLIARPVDQQSSATTVPRMPPSKSLR